MLVLIIVFAYVGVIAGLMAMGRAAAAGDDSLRAQVRAERGRSPLAS